jgi:hypothetical protein
VGAREYTYCQNKEADLLLQLIVTSKIRTPRLPALPIFQEKQQIPMFLKKKKSIDGWLGIFETETERSGVQGLHWLHRKTLCLKKEKNW